jgi:ABC-type uncharacterized transport system substrate-binding protein
VFEQRHFLRFHNAVNSGRTCIYLGKLFENDVLAHCRQSFFEKFRRQAPVKILLRKKNKNERTLRKVARNLVKRVDKCIDMNGHHFQHLL